MVYVKRFEGFSFFVNDSRAITLRREEEERHQNVAICNGFQLDIEKTPWAGIFT